MLKFGIIFSALVVAATAQVNAGDIGYFLTNRRVSGQRLTIGNYGANIDRTLPVKIIIHGWTESINSFWYSDAIRNYNTRGANVIAIDWSTHASQTYLVAVNRLDAIGSFVAQFVIGLSNSQNIAMSNIHLIGHSLGAHLSGFTGQNILSQSRQTLGRITGLDPAGPSFEGSLRSRRLSDDDASYVDIIHTDASLLGLGHRGSIGDADFYPNGGTASQPGCFIYLCSHNRAPRFNNEAILSNRFVARACRTHTNYNLGLCNRNQINIMGEQADRSARGDFYLNTGRSSPFALG